MVRPVALPIFASTLAALVSVNADAAFIESFETDGQGSRYTASTPFNDGTSDHWNRTDGSDISNVSSGYLGADGDYYWAAEDTDDNGGNGNDLQTLVFEDIDISGLTDLEFTGLFAAGNERGPGASAYDATDFMRVNYAVDNGAETNGVWFSYQDNGDDFNEPIGLDTDFDGAQDGAILSTTFQSFGFSIPEGDSLDLFVSVFADAASEELAFDFFQVTGTAIPEPTSLAMVGIVAIGLVGRRRRR